VSFKIIKLGEDLLMLKLNDKIKTYLLIYANMAVVLFFFFLVFFKAPNKIDIIYLAFASTIIFGVINIYFLLYRKYNFILPLINVIIFISVFIYGSVQGTKINSTVIIFFVLISIPSLLTAIFFNYSSKNKKKDESIKTKTKESNAVKNFEDKIKPVVGEKEKYEEMIGKLKEKLKNGTISESSFDELNNKYINLIKSIQIKIDEEKILFELTDEMRG
jgi:hypothetical protein